MKFSALAYKRLAVYVLSALVVFFSSGALSYFFLGRLGINTKITSVDLTKPIITPDPRSYYNILLLGYGGAGHSGGGLSDALTVANIDFEKKKITLISVPRDLWVEIPVRSDIKENHKINFAFAIGGDDRAYPLKEPKYVGEHGGGEMAKYVVSQVIGMPINYYIAVDFGGFERAIDALGGIEVDVPKTFNDYFYPVRGLENEPCGKTPEEIASLTNTLSGFELEKQFPCRYEQLRFEAGENTMGGTTALKFVRSRHSNEHGGDFARSERQKAVLFGVRDKLLSLGGVPKAPEFFDQLVSMVKTDLNKNIIRGLIENHADAEDYSVSTIYLTTENVFRETRSSDGQFILLPKEGEDWSEVQNFVARELLK